MDDIRSFRKTLRVFEQILNTQFQFCCCGVSIAQCHCLFAIEDLGRTTVSELADYLKLDKSTLSRTVDNLHKSGLIDRHYDLKDRRSYHIAMTADGQKQVRRMHSVNDEYFSRIFEHIPLAEREKVIRYIEVFVGAVLKEESHQQREEYCADE